MTSCCTVLNKMPQRNDIEKTLTLSVLFNTNLIIAPVTDRKNYFRLK